MAGGLTEYLMQKYSLAAEEDTGRPAQVDMNRRLVAFSWGELHLDQQILYPCSLHLSLKIL